MGSTAQLPRPRTSQLDHPHHVAVLLTEHRLRAQSLGVGQRHLAGSYAVVGADRLVRDALQFFLQALAERLGGIEVEAQVTRLVVRTRLVGALAEQLPQRRVHDVSRRVRLARAVTRHRIDSRHHPRAGSELTVVNANLVHHQALNRTLHVQHLEAQPVAGDQSGVGVLAASLRIERRLVEHDLHHVTRLSPLDQLTVGDDAADGGVGGELGEAQERNLARGPQRPVRLRGDGRTLLRLRVGLCALTLLSHQLAEALAIDTQSLLGGHFQGQIDREAVGVVQLEGLRTADLAALGLGLARGQIEDLRSGSQRPAEGFFLGVGDLRDALPFGIDLGVGGAHHVAAHRQQLRQHRIVHPKQTHRANRTAQQAAQHIAAGLIAGSHPIGHQHQRRTDVVGDHAHPHVVIAIAPVGLARQLGRPGQHRTDLVDLVHVVDALQQIRDPLQAHAGVDVLARQRPSDIEVVLGAHRRQFLGLEHQVPDLQEPILVGLRTAVGAELRAAIDVDL